MRRTLSLISLILIPALGAAADQLVLVNGDRLTGRVTEFDGAALRMNTELAGSVRVQFASVATLTTDEPLAITLSDDTVLYGTLAVEHGCLRIVHDDTATVLVKPDLKALRSPDAQRSYEARRRPRLLQLWQGHVDTGLAASRGNSDTTTFSLATRGERQTLLDKWTAYFNSLFTRDSTEGPSETIANSLRYGTRYERNVNERFFSFGFTELESDAVQDLDLRWVLGGGMGYYARRSATTEFQLFAGSSLNQEFFEGEDVRRSGEALIGEEFSHQLTSRTSLRERFTFYPNLTEPGEYRMTLDASAAHRLSGWLSWQATLSNRFLSNPPPGRERNDLVFTTGLRFTFGESAR